MENDSVSIFVLDAARLDPDDERWVPFRAAPSAAALGRMQNARARRLSLGAELVLGAALRLYGLSFVGAPAYLRAPGGRPYIPGGPHFSIAHAGRAAACAVSPEPIGFDMESAERRIMPGLADRVLSPREAEFGADVLRVWVAKESYLKYTGEGLAGPDMRELTFERGAVLRGGREAAQVRLFEAGGYIMALSSGRGADIRVRFFTEEEIFDALCGRRT